MKQHTYEAIGEFSFIQPAPSGQDIKAKLIALFKANGFKDVNLVLGITRLTKKGYALDSIDLLGQPKEELPKPKKKTRLIKKTKKNKKKIVSRKSK